MREAGRGARPYKLQAPPAVILIRVLVGAVFLEEGIQKFLFPALLGEGRFGRIGIPWPNVMGPVVGAVEVFCGALLLLGFFTRLASLPLVCVISTAIASTKLPILLGHGYGPFHLAQLNRYGFWAMASESRTDFSMLAGLLFLLITGPGRWSLDAVFFDR